MSREMVEALIAQGMGRREAYGKLSLYYQLLSEGKPRSEARKVLRPNRSTEYLHKLVQAAFREICDKGFMPEEVSDAFEECLDPEQTML